MQWFAGLSQAANHSTLRMYAENVEKRCFTEFPCDQVGSSICSVDGPVCRVWPASNDLSGTMPTFLQRTIVVMAAHAHRSS
jgi:hypothetical protein